MTSPLLDLIKAAIRDKGPMDIGTYMELCLSHPEHGYYMTRDPFGERGDFTTAPEISQLFGEMIGVWLADAWMKLGSPSEFILLECGPGRGTLMVDILRATRNVEGFHAAKRLYLMEISPVLKTAQAKSLGQYDPSWIATLDDVPAAIPVLVVANEFLDALPIRQLERKNAIWYERAVTLDNNDTLCLQLKKPDFPLTSNLPARITASYGDGVYETSPLLNRFIKFINITLLQQGGAALFIDYGHARSSMGDTLQAMRSHRFVSIFDTPGHCDLTAHIDFENISSIADNDRIKFHGPVTQGRFLKSLGIERRAERLLRAADERQREHLASGLGRLLDTKQMGSLFKVISLCHDPNIILAGFDEAF